MRITKTILFFALFLASITISKAQFTYSFKQNIPIEENNKALMAPWAGGFNAAQYNEVDLDNNGTVDLMIFDRDNNKVYTYLKENGQLHYAPEFEHLFPTKLENWVLLRDYNCDGKVDLFCSSIFGMSLYENTSLTNSQLSWNLVYETIFTEGANGQINLQISGMDLPGIQDVDGDGDLDVLAFNFAVGGGVNFHKNLAVERTGSCGLDLEHITDRYGDFEECTCEEYIFGSDVCNSGGRLQHSGGKSINSYPYANMGVQDLLIGQEQCTYFGYLPNSGSTTNPVMNQVSFDFPNTTDPVKLNYPAVYNIDVDDDGDKDLIATNNIFETSNGTTDYAFNNWFYQNTGGNYSLITRGFLQEEMLDIGYNAAAAFYDIDFDGDEDMIVGSGNQGDGGRLYFYLNDGDALSPSLVLIDADYLQESVAQYDKTAPQFIDLNADGFKDLLVVVVANGQQLAQIFWHTNNPLQPYMASEVSSLNLPSLFINDNPHFFYSGAKLTMFVARESGRLTYYVNQGTVENTIWEIIEDNYLGIADNFKARNLHVFTTDMDADGNLDLIRYDDSGVLRIHENYKNENIIHESLLENEATLTTYNSSFGTKASITTTFIDGAKLPSIVVGLRTGGLQILTNTSDEKQEIEVAIKLALFPNPVAANTFLTIVANQDVSGYFTDLQGRQLTNRITLSKAERTEFDMRLLRTGLYLFVAQNALGKQSSSKVIISN